MNLSDSIDVLQEVNCESEVTGEIYEALQTVLTAVVLHRYRVTRVDWSCLPHETAVFIAGELPECGAGDEIIYLRKR